jgi:hypothetical protein
VLIVITISDRENTSTPETQSGKRARLSSPFCPEGGAHGDEKPGKIDVWWEKENHPVQLS